MSGKPPFLRNVIHKRDAKANLPFKISLEADWPTPSWSHEKTTIDFDHENNVVVVGYLGFRRPGVAMQVIMSFSVDLELTIPEKGLWRIVVKGRSEDWESSITIN